MKVTIKITKDNGEEIEIERTMEILGDNNVITRAENEVTALKEELFPLLSSTLIEEHQTFFAEKGEHKIKKKRNK
jgi:hypothetical protein